MDDWDTVTKIGSKSRGGGAPRETVVRGNAQLNAAKRSGGVIATEKKYATGNAARGGGAGGGQFQTKVDRSDDIIKPKTMPEKAKVWITEAREKNFIPTMKQKELAQLTNIPLNLIIDFEKKDGKAVPTQEQYGRMERVLNVKLQGKDLAVRTAKFPNKEMPVKR